MKYIVTLIITLLLIFSSCMNSFAATKEDVIEAINKTYVVGDETYRLPDSIIKKGEKYLNKKELSPEKYDIILNSIERAVGVAKKAGTTDISKLDKNEIKEGLSAVLDASKAADVNATEKLSNIIPEEINSDLNNKNDNNNNTSESFIESGEEIVSGDYSSGEKIDKSIISREVLNNINIVKNDSEIIEQTIDRNIKIVIIGIIIVLFLSILIIVLLIKSKWNKIIKSILIVIFSILLIAFLVCLWIGISYIDEIKMLYKLYYLFV